MAPSLPVWRFYDLAKIHQPIDLMTDGKAISIPRNRNRILKTNQRDYYLDLFLLIASLLFNAIFLVLLPGFILTIFLGIVTTLFVPGYALLAVLYPDYQLGHYKYRFLASFGLSVVVSSLLTLIANYLISFYLISSFLAIFVWTVLLVLFAAYRRYQFERNSLDYLGVMDQKKDGLFVNLDKWKLTQFFLLFVLLLSAGRLIITSSSANSQFTEFYLLGADQLAGNLPEQVQAGQHPCAFIGIANHEGQEILYKVNYQIEGQDEVLLKEVRLNDEDTWEENVGLPAINQIGRYKISFTLHKGDNPVAYRSIHYWSNVVKNNP